MQHTDRALLDPTPESWGLRSADGQTMQRADEGALETALLPRWFDVDHLASLHRLADSLTGSCDGSYAAPAVRASLSVNRAALTDDSASRNADNGRRP